MPTKAPTRRGERTIEINGGHVVYEILDKTGDLIALTPGGRFNKDIPGLRPLAHALVKGGYRVLLWDRPNCGKSDVQFYGQSESHMRAATLHTLITDLGVGPCILAGGSGGARDSMPTTMLYHEIVTKLVVWNIVGGVYRSFVLGSYYIVPSILAVRGLGSKGLLTVPEWQERIEENPDNQQRLLNQDADEFLKVMLRWLNAFVSKPGQTIPGVEDEMFDRIKLPTLIIRGGENDVRHLGAGRAADPRLPRPLMAQRHRPISDREDAYLAVQPRLERGMNPALGHPGPGPPYAASPRPHPSQARPRRREFARYLR